MYSIYALKGKGINVESFIGRNLVGKTFDYLYTDSKSSMLDWFIVLYVSCLAIIKELSVADPGFPIGGAWTS